MIGRARAASARPLPSSTSTATASRTSISPRRSPAPRACATLSCVNKGNGSFEDATAAFGLPLDQASLGVAAADFDADRQIDLFLTGAGRNRLLHNRDGKSFEDLTPMLKAMGPPAISLAARWLDLDQDGDLDLYVVNYCSNRVFEQGICLWPGAAAGTGLLGLSQRWSARTDSGKSRTGLGTPGRGLGERQGEGRVVAGAGSLDRGGAAPGRESPPHRNRRARC